MNPDLTIVLGAPRWLTSAVVLGVVALLLILWSYSRGNGSLGLRALAGLLKVAAVIALAGCLVEPLFSGVRPRPGANLFVIAADNSRSLQLRDPGMTRTRGEGLAAQLDDDVPWQARLSQDFDVRRYVFDSEIRPVADFGQLDFSGEGSALGTALTTVAKRYQGRPVAGVLLLTDGNATDLLGNSAPAGDLPPVYPVVIGRAGSSRDIRISRVSVSQTNFEASPVTVLVEASCDGYQNTPIVFQLLDDQDRELQRQSLRSLADGELIVHRFLLQPENSGVSFFRVRVFARQDEALLDRPDRISETTLENNSRLVAVDRGGGPYRVLYLSGRPNWEFKFLRRAIQEDDEVNLVGLVRIAKKEPKFTFRGHKGESTNPLFRGFDNQEDEEAEQYDQPVLLRLGVREGGEELRDGFPKSAAELFQYSAIILDEIEAKFFTQDQLSLIQEFVSQRGGGFLMLGGKESFASGDYVRTPIGELMPVYLDRPQGMLPGTAYQLSLTRDGWLQPWTRLRTNEQDENKRLAAMPSFFSLNPIQSIKPGATVLAHVSSSDGRELPALVVQQFGKGRSAALLVGDLWRWNLKRLDSSESDLEKSWRQTLRWLVADVPARVDPEVRPNPDDPQGAIDITVRVRDEEFEPSDNVDVEVRIETPDGSSVVLSAEPSERTAGGYEVTFAPRKSGAYRAEVIATAADGSEVGRREIGWATEPATMEFQHLAPNLELLEKLANESGGEVVELEGLTNFVASLPNRKVPVTEPWIYPLWHQWSVFMFAVACLAGEWGLRRWKGLP